MGGIDAKAVFTDRIFGSGPWELEKCCPHGIAVEFDGGQTKLVDMASHEPFAVRITEGEQAGTWRVLGANYRQVFIQGVGVS